MNAEQRIKREILLVVDRWQKRCNASAIMTMDSDQIDKAYDEAENGDDCDYIQDARSEIRKGHVETGLDCDYSRYYESNAVAMKCCDGSWVGWTYFYGGGKHGQPEEMEWMSGSCLLSCKEEEKVVIVRTFEKQESAQCEA